MVVLKRVSHLILSGEAIGYSGQLPAADKNTSPTNTRGQQIPGQQIMRVGVLLAHLSWL